MPWSSLLGTSGCTTCTRNRGHEDARSRHYRHLRHLFAGRARLHDVAHHIMTERDEHGRLVFKLGDEQLRVAASAKPWKTFKKVATTRALQVREPFVVHTLEGVMVAQEGDYLCMGDAGDVWPVKKEIFESTYEESE